GKQFTNSIQAKQCPPQTKKNGKRQKAELEARYRAKQELITGGAKPKQPQAFLPPPDTLLSRDLATALAIKAKNGLLAHQIMFSQAQMLHQQQQQQQKQVQKQKHLYKVLVLGEVAVGKTSIITDTLRAYFRPPTRLPLVWILLPSLCNGMQIQMLPCSFGTSRVTKRFGHMTRSYYRYRQSLAVVWSSTCGHIRSRV
uniref:DNK domain-containing protein n=1 Tax=Macrostomum lignano TaxID=282301 RepID=A0A1I8FJH0_9PLAT